MKWALAKKNQYEVGYEYELGPSVNVIGWWILIGNQELWNWIYLN